MKQITLNAKPRTGTGRTASKNLRSTGVVPAVIYGESGNRNLALDARELTMALRKIAGSATLIELKTEGDTDTHFAIIKELVRNPRTDAFVHVDFKEVVRGKPMEADVPVRPKGVADGVRNFGGVLEISAHTLRVRCLPRNLPEAIYVEVTDLGIGKSVHLAEVPAPEGVTFLDDPHLVVLACVGSSGGRSGAEETAAAGEAEAAAAPAAEGAAAPAAAPAKE